MLVVLDASDALNVLDALVASGVSVVLNVVDA